MRLKHVKFAIKEEINRLNRRRLVNEDVPSSIDTVSDIPTNTVQTPSGLNPNFINNMESLYASKGCAGLMKKSEHFVQKMDKVSHRTGAGAPAWAGQLEMKIDHIATMLDQMGCNDDTSQPTMV